MRGSSLLLRISGISRQCHDLKHQVAALRRAYSEEEKEAYLSELERSIARYNAYCNTGNPVLDCILTQKQIYCEQHAIQLNYHVDGKPLAMFAAQDICIIFGNLLDNAIEHVSLMEDQDKRQITLEVYARSNLLMVQVENCCDVSPVISDGLPETTKKDKQRHGFGLKSVKLVAYLRKKLYEKGEIGVSRRIK